MKMKIRVPRDHRALARQARGQGWRLALCGSGHLAWRSPAGALVISSGSRSDWRALHKLRAELRRHGLTDELRWRYDRQAAPNPHARDRRTKVICA
jgi:hypothetical protein